MQTICNAFAFVLAVLAAFSVPSGRFNLIAGALAFFFLGLLVGAGLHVIH